MNSEQNVLNLVTISFFSYIPIFILFGAKLGKIKMVVLPISKQMQRSLQKEETLRNKDYSDKREFWPHSDFCQLIDEHAYT